MTPEEAGRVFVDPTAYADVDRFHDGATFLRRRDPVHWVDEPGYLPFWVVTRHADVIAVERDNSLFLSAPIMKYIDPGPGFQAPELVRPICSWSSAPDNDDSERS